MRATHVEAPAPAPPAPLVKSGRDGFWSGASRFPDIYGEPLPPDEAQDEGSFDAPPAAADDEPDDEPLGYDEPDGGDDEAADRDATAVLPAAQARRRRGPHAAGPPARLGHRRSRLPVGPAEPDAAQALVGRAVAPRHRRAGAHRQAPDRGPRPLRRRGEDRRHRRRPAHHPLRAAPRARHQDEQGRPAQGRPRLRARGDRHPHPRADPRQDGGRRRGAQRAPAHRPARRRQPGRAARLVAADDLARQGRRRQGDRRRPREDAAPARRRHDRRRQVGLHQRDALERAAARDAARAAARADRPQAGRAQPLRVDPAPADARHHEPADGRQRAAEPRPRDGAALLDHVAGQDALARRAQPLPRPSAATPSCPTSSASSTSSPTS